MSTAGFCCVYMPITSIVSYRISNCNRSIKSFHLYHLFFQSLRDASDRKVAQYPWGIIVTKLLV